MTNLKALRQAGISGFKLDYNQLVKTHYENAYKKAYSLTHHKEDAEDLVQETFLRAFRFFDSYDPKVPFEAWLCKIMRNAWIDEYRKSPKYKNPIISFKNIDETIKNDDGEVSYEIPDNSTNPEVIVEREELKKIAKKALDELKPEFRKVLILADVEDKSYEEIAEITKTNIGTVRSRIHRARNIIKDKIKSRL